jgi:hypothetical protein
VSHSDEFRRQVNELWKQAVDQLEEVKDTLTRSRGRIEADMLRLRRERDRLLRRLGEQTFRLANQGKLPMPSLVKRTVERLNEVIEGLVVEERKTSANAGSDKATVFETSTAEAGSKRGSKTPRRRKATGRKTSPRGEKRDEGAKKAARRPKKRSATT